MNREGLLRPSKGIGSRPGAEGTLVVEPCFGDA